VNEDRAQLRTLAIALLVSLVLWNLPFGGLLLYPFKLLATWLHELSHGVAMIAMGAGFDHMLIYRDTSGLAYPASSTSGFGVAVIAAAGYMGTPLWGAMLLVLTPTARTARWALLGLALLLAVTVVLVIDNRFGQWAMTATAAVFALAGLALPARWRVATAHFVAAQACINALLDIRVLLRPQQIIDGQIAGASDAHTMALATFHTTDNWAVWTWAIVWLVWALVVLYAGMRVAAKRAELSESPVAAI
jgi:hypothetical protein